MKTELMDLSDVVRKMLIEHGIQDQYVQVYNNAPEIRMIPGRDILEQRALMNKFWFLQLSSLDISTIKERYCLISDGEIVDWIRLFKEEVLPFVAERQLPRFNY